MIASARVASVQAAQGPIDSSDRPLPPGERAWEAYRLIEIEGLSTRAAAGRVGLSQTRVIQLRDTVEHWIASRPRAGAGLTKQQRLQAAEYKAGLRLDHLYGLALEAFRQSQGEELVCEEAIGGPRLVKTRVTQGNTRYLQMAMRIAAQQSRIPPVSLSGDADFEIDASAIADSVADDGSPPEEDCSPETGEQGGSVEAAVEPGLATVAEETASATGKQQPTDVNEAFATDFFPVQTDVRVDAADSLEEPVLTRKQRKRRARMLAALRKG